MSLLETSLCPGRFKFKRPGSAIMISACAVSIKLALTAAIYLLLYLRPTVGTSPAPSLDDFSSLQSQLHGGPTPSTQSKDYAPEDVKVYDTRLPRSFSRTTDPGGSGNFEDQARYIRVMPKPGGPNYPSITSSPPRGGVKGFGAKISPGLQKLPDSRLNDKSHDDNDAIYTRVMSGAREYKKSGGLSSLTPQTSLPDVAYELMENHDNTSKKRKLAENPLNLIGNGEIDQHQLQLDIISQMPEKERERYLKEFKSSRRSKEKAQKEEKLRAKKIGILQTQLHEVDGKIGRELGGLKRETDYQEAVILARLEKGKRQIAERKLRQAQSGNEREASGREISRSEHDERTRTMREGRLHNEGKLHEPQSMRFERPPTSKEERSAERERLHKTQGTILPTIDKTSGESDLT